MDLAKAYDSIDRSKLWGILLHELDVPPHLVAQLQHLYHHLHVSLAGHTELDPIAVRVGLKQGCPTSPLLFSLLFDRVAASVAEAINLPPDEQHQPNCNPPPPSSHLFSFLTLQLLLLLFADDVALLARSARALEALYTAFKAFCQDNHLNINHAKTKALVARADPDAVSITLAGDTFERVTSFRYLGVEVDARGNPATISQHLLSRARGSLAALCDYVGSQRWTIPWTRLVLYDVYIRTHLTFAAAVWTPQYLRLGVLALDDGPLGRLTAQYRRGLRLLLRTDSTIRSTILYIVACRWPIEVLLAKASWRYYHRVNSLMGTSSSSSPTSPMPIATISRWTLAQAPGTYPLQRGLAMASSIPSAPAIYAAWLTTLRADLATSTRLAHPHLQIVWQTILELGLRRDAVTARGRLTLPPGETITSLRHRLPGSHWSADESA